MFCGAGITGNGTNIRNKNGAENIFFVLSIQRNLVVGNYVELVQVRKHGADTTDLISI